MTDALRLDDMQMGGRFRAGLALSLGINTLAVALAAWSATVIGSAAIQTVTPPEYTLTFPESAAPSTPTLAPTPKPVEPRTHVTRKETSHRPRPRIDRLHPRSTLPVARLAVRTESAFAPSTPHAEPAAAPHSPTVAALAATPSAAVRSAASPLTAAPSAAAVSAPVAARLASGTPRSAATAFASERRGVPASAVERDSPETPAPSGVLVAAFSPSASVGSGSVARRDSAGVAAAVTGRVVGVASAEGPTVARASFAPRLAHTGAFVSGTVASERTIASGADREGPAVGPSTGDSALRTRLSNTASSGAPREARTAATTADASRREPQVRVARESGSDATVAEPSRSAVERPVERSTGGELAVAGRPNGAPAGENRDAERTFDPAPELSSELKRRPFDGRVLVEVTVEADGSHSVRLAHGSGDSEVDAAILKALRRWRWKPALRDGQKVKTTHNFRYTVRISD